MEYKVALAGNPNSGKTTVFNLLCGAKGKIGNWPGTTVERKEGYLIYKDKKIKIVDLPGTYSLTAYSIDERIARDFLIREKPDLVVAVIDASNLERNLYLVSQLKELGLNLLLDLNMMDVVEKQGININIQKLSQILRVGIVKTIASKDKGIEELKNKILENLEIEHKILNIDYGREIKDALIEIVKILKGEKINLGYPYQSLAIKFLEEDQEIIEKLKDSSFFETLKAIKDRISLKIEKEYFENLETFIIEKRYAFLKGVVKESVDKIQGLEERFTLSDRIDKVVTHRFLGIPIFLLSMYLLFQLVFTLGSPLADLIDNFFGNLSEMVKVLFLKLNLSAWFVSLFSDGIISGVGSVLVFLPNILLLFLGISFLEDTGYLARAAFVMDRFMHSLGLHGKSFIPLLLGFGCNIPGIMATRTLEAKKDRILTILVNPLMSCSARLPVYVLFASAFFPENQGLIVFSLYLLGIILAIIVAKVFKGLFFKEEFAPLVMELPPYRLPTLRNILLHMWIRASLFVKKAGTIIFLAVVLVWLLSSLPKGVEYASSNSLIGKFGKLLAPIFKPAGFGFWQAAVSLIFGILAKEVVVGTLGTLFGVGEEGLKAVLPQYFTPLSAYAFLIMTLIYIPCIATIAVIKRETNWKWTILAVGYSLILGWVLSVIFYQIGKLF